MSRPLPRYTQTPIPHDPLEIMLAQREAQHQAAREAINTGTHTPAEAALLRGIPCIAQGISGTSPGTQPHHALKDPHRLRRTLTT